VRRLVAALTIALLLTVLVSAPALAMFHDKIANPFLHLLADVGLVAAIAAPLVTLWYRVTARRTSTHR
jgi:hypothetical protein